MTLTPDSRVLLTDALRPPAGYRVDVAVGTTYSLDLTALLLAPLSFALFDVSRTAGPVNVDPIRLLEAVRRHTEHTTVFCHAGAIHVPANYNSILTFIEDSVREVVPPSRHAIFHPKIWALRFADQSGHRLHRLVCLSRNLTMDRSWDTALVLDEDADGTIDAAPAADFVRDLPGLAIHSLSSRADRFRLTKINDLADSLRTVTLQPPEPFSDGELLPLGLTADRPWPFPASARRLVAISPFLDRTSVKEVTDIAPDRLIVSRPETLDRLGWGPLEGWQVNVLQRMAEVGADEDVGEGKPSTTEFIQPGEGLHAKTYVLDLSARRSTMITGSANLTSAGWGANVEFDVVLSGPTNTCGVAAMLEGTVEAPGLGNLLEEYTIHAEIGDSDEAVETAYLLDRFHQALAESAPTLHLSHEDQDRVRSNLQLTMPTDPPGITRLWPATLSGDRQGKALAESLEWVTAQINVTPFVVVETTAGEGVGQATRRCVLMAKLTGDVTARHREVLASILKSKEDVLRYLVFLLGDPSYDVLFAQLSDGGDAFADLSRSIATSDATALFEPLVRATGRDEDALARVASLVEELQRLSKGDQLVPDGFEQLWDVIWQVHQERS